MRETKLDDIFLDPRAQGYHIYGSSAYPCRGYMFILLEILLYGLTINERVRSRGSSLIHAKWKMNVPLVPKLHFGMMFWAKIVFILIWRMSLFAFFVCLFVCLFVCISLAFARRSSMASAQRT
jgi:hypothetical protein